jgi:hypothetical protein
MWLYRTRKTKSAASSSKEPPRCATGGSNGKEGRDDFETLQCNVVGLKSGMHEEHNQQQQPSRIKIIDAESSRLKFAPLTHLKWMLALCCLLALVKIWFAAELR